MMTGRSDQYDRRPSSRNLDRLSIESKRFTVNFSIYFNLTDFYPFFFEDYDRRLSSRNLGRLSIEIKRFTFIFSFYFNLTVFYPFFFEDYDRSPPSSEQ